MSPTKSSIGFAWTMMLHPWTQVGGDSTAGLVLTHTVQTHTVEVGVHFGTKFELVCEHFTCTYANRMSECGGGSGYAFWYQIDVTAKMVPNPWALLFDCQSDHPVNH